MDGWLAIYFQVTLTPLIFLMMEVSPEADFPLMVISILFYCATKS